MIRKETKEWEEWVKMRRKEKISKVKSSLRETPDNQFQSIPAGCMIGRGPTHPNWGEGCLGRGAGVGGPPDPSTHPNTPSKEGRQEKAARKSASWKVWREKEAEKREDMATQKQVEVENNECENEKVEYQPKLKISEPGLRAGTVTTSAKSSSISKAGESRGRVSKVPKLRNKKIQFNRSNNRDIREMFQPRIKNPDSGNQIIKGEDSRPHSVIQCDLKPKTPPDFTPTQVSQALGPDSGNHSILGEDSWPHSVIQCDLKLKTPPDFTTTQVSEGFITATPEPQVRPTPKIAGLISPTLSKYPFCRQQGQPRNTVLKNFNSNPPDFYSVNQRLTGSPQGINNYEISLSQQELDTTRPDEAILLPEM